VATNSAVGIYEPASQVWTDPVTGAILGVLTRQGVLQASAAQALGLPGATGGARLAGGTVSGPPVTGTFQAGDVVPDLAGVTWVCTAAGTPGTWVSRVVSGQYLCPPVQYAPNGVASLSVTGTTFAAFSSANVNTGAFTAPASGSALVTASFVAFLATPSTEFNVGLAAHGTITPMVGFVIAFQDTVASVGRLYTPQFLVTGLTPGTSYNLDLMGACGAAGDVVTISANGQSSTTSRNFNSGPVLMTVQAV
jgi:hypothetical protein